MRFLTLFLFISIQIFAQDFTSIKAKTDSYKRIKSAETLAEKINKDFSSDEDKVKAVFYWLTSNISYDLEEYYNPASRRTSFRYRTEEERLQILQDIKDKRVSETIVSKKAVCEGYAQTFTKVCNLLNIESEVISGYARFGYQEINKPQPNSNHAWNAVKIDNEWLYLDATWGAGSVVNGKWKSFFKPYYYNMPKEKVLKSHLPKSSVWQLRLGRITKEAFYNQPIYTNKFLATNIELISPKQGILKKDKNGNISIQLKNVIDKQVLIGFRGSKIAKRPIIEVEKDISTISIAPPKGAKVLFLVIDGEVSLQYLLE